MRPTQGFGSRPGGRLPCEEDNFALTLSASHGSIVRNEPSERSNWLVMHGKLHGQASDHVLHLYDKCVTFRRRKRDGIQAALCRRVLGRVNDADPPVRRSGVRVGFNARPIVRGDKPPRVARGRHRRPRPFVTRASASRSAPLRCLCLQSMETGQSNAYNYDESGEMHGMTLRCLTTGFQYRIHDVIPFLRRKGLVHGFVAVMVTLHDNAARILCGIVGYSLAPEHNLNR